MKDKISKVFYALIFVFILYKIAPKEETPQVEEPKPVAVQKPKPQPKITVVEDDLIFPKAGDAQDIATREYARVVQLPHLDQKAKYGYAFQSHSQPFAYVKPSTLNQMYFVNGYLNGFVPYEVDNFWVVLQYLQTRLKYQLDAVGYAARKEVWQTAKESFVRLRGDCEDHAILLADWLIGLGYDARVAVGIVNIKGQKPSGHAWVVLFHEGQEYLLEATKKSKWSSVPLASTQPYYFPKLMFNRTEFWINTGTTSTTLYSGAKWKKSGRFIPDNPYYKDLQMASK